MTRLADSRVRIQEAYATVAAVEAATRLGLLRVLAQRPSTVGDLASACRIDRRGADALLRVLAHLGLVEGVDGRYRSPGEFEDPSIGLWKGLEARLRDGVIPVACDTTTGAASLYAAGAKSLAAITDETAPSLARLLVEPRMQVLDVGAGAAPWSIAMHQLDPSIHVTALDLPEVVVTTRQSVAEADAADGFSYIEGDLFEVDIPQATFDVAVLGMLCHLFGADRNRALLRRVSDALRPGGHVAIVDIVPDPAGHTPPSRLVDAYDLSLFLRTHEGRAHPFSSLTAWLHETGFEHIERIPIPGAFSLTLVRARKAA